MAYDLSDVRILVVDPSPFRRMLICDVLKAIGVEQFEAVDQGGDGLSRRQLLYQHRRTGHATTGRPRPGLHDLHQPGQPKSDRAGPDDRGVVADG